MNKLIKLALSVLLILSTFTMTAFAETGDSYDDPILNYCSYTEINGNKGIRCQQSSGEPLFVNANVEMMFVKETNEQFNFRAYRNGSADWSPNSIQMTGEGKADFVGDWSMPAGNYELYMRVQKNGSTKHYKITNGYRYFDQILNEAPRNVSISSNGNGGLQIQCYPDPSLPESGMPSCMDYLTTLKNSREGTVGIYEYDEDGYMHMGNDLSRAGNNADGKVFEWQQGKLIISNEHFSDIFDNKKSVIEIRNVDNYTKMYAELDSLTITAPSGSKKNPIQGCEIRKNPNSSEKNAYIATCPNGDVIFTNDGYDFDNRSLYLIEKDSNGNPTGNEYLGFNLYRAIIDVNNKELQFDNSTLEDSHIYVLQNGSNGGYTYVPAGKYDVLFEKTNSMGQGGSGTFYLLGSNVEFDQIKNPTPTTAYIKNDTDNSILIGCDVTEAGCSNWLEDVYNNIPRRTRAMGGGSVTSSEIMFDPENGGYGVYFNGIYNIEQYLEKVFDNGEMSAIRIPGDKLAQIGFDNILYNVSITAYRYSDVFFRYFTPNVVLQDPSELLEKITITQDDKFPFTIKVECQDEESYQFVKNTRFIVYDVNNDDRISLGWFGMDEWAFDDATKSAEFQGLYSTEYEKQDVEIEIDSKGYEKTNIDFEGMNFIYTQDIDDEKIVISTNGIQIYSENEDFLKFLVGLIPSKYPNIHGNNLYVNTYDNEGNPDMEDEHNNQFISLDDLYGSEVHTNPINGKKYVLINTPKLAELVFDQNKIYSFSFMFGFDYSYGNLSTDRYVGLTNDYFKGLSEDNSYSDMTDDENLKILGVVLGMDATDNNPNSIKLIYKEVQKNGNTEDLGVDMPKVVGAIIERENEKGGFSKDNLDYLDANKVELGITFDNLDEADLEEGFKKFDVTKTDVGFEVTLTNKYFNGSEEVREDNIEELPSEATITFDLPDEELEDGKEYMLLTVHKGKPKLIKIKVEKDPVTGKNRGTALVSQFSPFMVVEVAKNTGGNTGSTIPGGTSSKPIYIVNTSTK